MNKKELSYRERWGLFPSIFASLYECLRSGLGLRTYGIHTRPVAAPSGPDPEVEGVSFRLFKKGDAEALIASARLPELDLPEHFVREALEKDDICDAVLCDGSIVSYSWTAFTQTHDDDGVFVGFGKEYGYGYKAFTLPDYRGRHLLRFARPRRDRYFIESGRCTHLIAFIGLSNRSSVRFTHAMGYRRAGTAGYFKRGSWFWAFRSPGAKRCGFCFFLPLRSANEDNDRGSS